MKKVLVTSDSTCSLPRSEAEKIGLPILALNVIVDGIEYHDGIDIDQERLAKMMRSGASIKTSTPTPYEIETFFDALFAQGHEEIVHFTISSHLSSMFDLFTNTCRQKYGDKVHVIDSKSVCYFMYDHVLTARAYADMGMSGKEIVANVQKRIGCEKLIFIPESLTYLKRGGRISPFVAAIGNFIGMKPILNFVDGAIEKNSTTRNIKKALEEKIKEFKTKDLNPEVHEFHVVVFDTIPGIADYAQSLLEKTFPNYTIIRSVLAINVAAHSGPGTIGVGITRKPTK